MKVTVNENKKELSFPKLMIRTDQQLIVYFRHNERGVVLFNGSSPYEIGNVGSFCMEYFKDFHGTITIEQ